MINVFTTITLIVTIIILISTLIYNNYEHKKETKVLYRLIKIHNKVIDTLEEEKDELKKEIFLLKSTKKEK